MAQYEIKFNRPDGWSYAEGECEIPVESAMVELSDGEVQILVELMQEHNSYDVEKLNLKERYPDIYNKLNEACESITENAVIAEALRDAHYDGDDYWDRLYEYCEIYCGYEESSDDFNSWLDEYASNLNSKELRNLYNKANIDLWDEVLNFDGIEIGEYEVTIPQSVVTKVFAL